ncbi:MAG: hypothetical protein M0R17_01635 [Candidatus Omnitrophica bacterium]|jgi:hypothetical protein|nr:hypothetical protein [Candidatus Omnitrophota bacterium]
MTQKIWKILDTTWRIVINVLMFVATIMVCAYLIFRVPFDISYVISIAILSIGWLMNEVSELKKFVLETLGNRKVKSFNTTNDVCNDRDIR